MAIPNIEAAIERISSHDGTMIACASWGDPGDPTVILTDSVELAVRRRLDGGDSGSSGATLTGTWSGQPVPVPLAYASPR